MWLIVGLGNPGAQYEKTRHNIGFRVIDELVRRHAPGAFRATFGSEIVSGTLCAYGERPMVLLQKPMEFMNVSGYAVQRAVHFHDLDVEKMVVIHDDLDLAVGRIKLKSGGGHGGHNGLRSIIKELGESDFARVRIGIGAPGPADDDDRAGQALAAGKDRRVSGYVLSNFPTAQHAQIEEVVGRAADATESTVVRGIRESMNEFNTREVAAE